MEFFNPKIPTLPGFDFKATLEKRGFNIGAEVLQETVRVTDCEELLEEEAIEEEFASVNSFEKAEILSVTTPFEKISEKMSRVDILGFVKKIIVRAGTGQIIDPKSVVLVHYQMYFEGGKLFDSTVRRKKPARLTLSENIEGMDIALSTMKVGEASRFLINHKLAFGELGCPERIPPKADILVDLELLRVVKLVEPEQPNEMPVHTHPFAEVLKKLEAMNEEGKNEFAQRKFDRAKRVFRDAINLVNRTPMRNAEEQKELEKIKVRLLANAAGIYYYTRSYEMVCILCDEGMQLDPNNLNILKLYARANIQFSNFHKAKIFIDKGMKLYPTEKCFEIELERLNKKQKRVELESKQ